VRRHESLRTSFEVADGTPLQVISEPSTINLRLLDISHLAKQERESEAQRLAREEAQRPFDLTAGPLLRATLLKLSAKEHVLLFTMHHIISDGWSMGLLVREVSALYSAYSRGEESPLEELPIQYADYAVWQREQMQGEMLEEQLAYWREQLAGAPAVLELPTDHARPVMQSFKGAGHSFELSKGLTEQLKQLSRREGVTLFMTLLAAFKVLLYRYTNQTDIVVGTPIAGRTRRETEGLIGFFVNTLALLTKVEARESFREMVRRVREMTLGAYAHQDIPFERLVEEIQPERSLSHTPLFQVMFVMQNAPAPVFELGGLRLSSVELINQAAKFDLTLELRESSQGLRGKFEYNADLFDARSIKRMARHLQVLLETIAANPEQRIAELPLLTTEEQKQLLVEWNNTAQEYPQNKCIHQLFESQVERTPENIALVFEDKQLTYAELNRRANQLAHYLRALGVGPEVLVGICMERSVEMVVAILGILKAGGAYVPLDPQYPMERLSFMMRDAAIKTLLTQERTRHVVGEQAAQVVCVDGARDEVRQHSGENPVSNVLADNAAYVIYTSGSTGQPKGVVVTHHNVTRLFAATEAEFRLTSEDVWTMFHSSAFDFSVWEMWGALLYGGRLVIVSYLESRWPEAFYQRLRRERVTVLNQTPSAFRQLVEAEGGSRWQELALRVVIFGGEALDVEILGGWYEGGEEERVRLVNMYGITETTVHVSFYELGKADMGKVSGSIIGKPIEDVQVYILDPQLRLIPVGISGEIYVGGAGVARGYLNRPELTAERFIPHTFSNEPGARLYRTGDLARYLPDGNIEFLGRVDHQVKLRGHRIELGEIEAVLSSHREVREAVVLAREDESGGKRLVAYVVSTGKEAASVSQLRQYLKERLPEHMIPSAFVRVEEMPLTANGKIDRKALAERDAGRVEREQEYVGAQTPIEELLCGIFAEVLKVERISTTDNFFELGGHSLLATQLISRVRTAFKVELPLRQLFEQPTVQSLATAIDSALRQGQEISTALIKRAPRDQPLPLSFAQQRLWFIDQLEPQSPLYNIPAAVRLTGELNVTALEQTFNEIIRRHEVLRTSFASVDGNPLQIISPAQPLNLPLKDLSHLAADEREVEAGRLTSHEAQQPFDLLRGPLFRVQLLRLSSTEHLLLCTMHHTVSDGWSMGILIREVAALYEAFSQHQPSLLPELAIQYADYAVWQRETLEGSALEIQLSYWREQLRGAPELLELPTDRPRPAIKSIRGDVHRLELSESLTEELRRLSRSEGVTLFMTLHSAFALLLSRYSGQEDVLVGSPIANRTRVETEDLIGFFVNTLVLRTKVEARESFREMVRRVREMTLGAYAHQDIPFEKLVEELQPERSLSHTPLFQVMFVMQNAPREALRFSELELNAAGTGNKTAQFDLTLELLESEEGLAGTLEYSTDLFDAGTIARLSGHFETLLEAIVKDPERSVSELPLLSTTEREQLIFEWNQTATEYPSERCVHELFEQQAERTPGAVAIISEDQEVTYAELNRRANQLAHYLRSIGVGPEVLVAICVERSVEMVIGLLGILKAGGAYVPLDPGYPQERLAFLLEDAHVSVLLTVQRLVNKLPAHKAQVVCLDDNSLASQSNVNPINPATIENLAYVVYTSGSTGQPKGVAISHSAFLNHNTAMAGYYGLQASDLVLQFSSISFDVAAEELFPSLLSGAAIVLPPLNSPMSAAEFLLFLITRKITIINLPAPYWHELVAELERLTTELASTLRLVITGSEIVSPERLAAWHKLAPEWMRWINAYGPTETTITSTLYESFGQKEQYAGGTVPIGRPIANTEVYLFDKRLEPVPVGVVGELYIGGAGVARGYLNRPELTAERFIPHPYSREAGTRLYRTGDLARSLPDGNIEYLGRLDQQVKLRGYRIELGEIEAQLKAHALVREAVVSLVREEEGEPRLVAYLVMLAGEENARLGQMRSYLKERLPEYMLPSVYVEVEQMPLLPGGKIDRKALAKMDGGRVAEREQEYAAPESQIEEILGGIWEEVLGVERVGINDNFFELGGHSLLATQLISRVRQAFKVEVPLRRLFEQPTMRALAKVIEAERQEQSGGQSPPILRVSREQNMPLSFAQQRLWFIDQLEPNSAVYNVHAAVRLDGQLNVTALEQTLTEVMRRHEALRTTFSVVDAEPVQVIAPARAVSLPLRDISHLPDEERESEAERLASEEAQQPFDLEHGPLLRATLLKLSAKEHVLLFTMHHIISDGWSAGVLIREVTTLYATYLRGEESPLEELPIQYADYAVWQREQMQGEMLEEQLAYWREQLAGAPAVLELPTDHARPVMQSYRGAVESFTLRREMSEGLKQLSRREGVTLFMTLLAAFKVLLYRYSGQEDIVVGTPIANRNRSEIEPLIGFFVNTLALRTELSGELTFLDLVKREREVCLGAYAHQEVSFERIVEELQPERSLSHAPLFQVMMVMQNAPEEALELGGMSVRAVAVEERTAKFDLGMTVKETERGIVGELQYNRDLYEAESIRRMIGHWNSVLEGVATRPEERIAELPLLSEEERRKILVEWNETAREYERDTCIHQLFEAQVERTPEQVAVAFGDKHLSYGELNQRANQLAHYLRALGVGPEVLVGLMMERSLEEVVAILGVLKAGGAYVPLDTQYPEERLSFMMRDAKVTLLVTEQRLLANLPDYKGQAVCIDKDCEVISEQSRENPTSDVLADNAAYVIYTSGSTGRPKGVVVRHQGVCNVITASILSFDIDSGSRVLQLASLSFDASVLEIFLALLTGSTLYLIEPDVLLSGIGLTRVLREQAINIIALTPSLLDTLPTEPLPDLSTIIVGGEVCSVETAKRWASGRLFVNAYAPTEATIYATALEWRENYHQYVPVGRPIANTEIYILGRHQEAVPVGVPGEIYIGGDGLARGYLNRAELTAERFIPHIFSNEPGARLYRTGDLTRYLPDGNIEFLGRVDQQVKIRGHRIELGEIETVLGEHPDVREVVVIAREDESGEKRLIAYVVSTEQAPSVSELHSYLKEKLPQYMIPSAFMLIDEMPLTANGKVDRKALPAQDDARPELETLYTAPRTAVEEIVAGIWSEVLKVERVGIYDNFFELGGDSILGIQIVARANQAGLHLTPKLLFQYQTVAELVATVDTAPVVSVEQGLVTGPVPLTPIQHQFFEQNLVGPHHFNQAVLLEVRQGKFLDAELLGQVVHRLLEHHDALRLRFVREQSSEWRQVNTSTDEAVPLTRVDLSGLPESEQGAAIEAAAVKAQSSLSLEEGPLMRVVFFEMGASKPSRLLIIIHHLIVDGVSWRLLLEDLQRGYEQLSRGAQMQLAPKTTSFKRWAEALVEYAQSEALQSELTYWLSIPQKAKQLPIDYAEDANTEASARDVFVELDIEQTRALLQEVPAAYHTEINDVLLTALAQSFTQWTGARSLLIDLEAHGREEQIVKDVDLSRTVGWFTTIFPVRLELGATGAPGEALKLVKEELRGIPHRGIGYGVLRYLYGAEVAEKLRVLPQAEVSFNYLGQLDQVLPESSLFNAARESSGPTRGLHEGRRYVLEIIGSIIGGQLRMTWRYSGNLHRRATIEALAERFIGALDRLIQHCTSAEAGGYTPSDFPTAKLSQRELDDLIEELGEPLEGI
jgi:amino acid adenylation domain-containing protein/non-ribosomal peptide synthase protein (TIGR01720 family)